MKKGYCILMMSLCLAFCGCSTVEADLKQRNNEYIATSSEKNVEHEYVEELNTWIVEKDRDRGHSSLESRSIEEEIMTTSLSNMVDSVVDINQENISEKQDLTDEDKNIILKEIDNFVVTDKETLNQLVSIIDTNIASFSQRERDLIVKKYILSMYNLMNNLNSILEIIGYDLEKVVDEYVINVNDKSSISLIPDTYGTVRGFLLEVKEKGFFVNSSGNNKGFYIDLDLGNMMDKYNDYISDSMIAYMNFNNYEMNNILSDYDLDEIANRIGMLEDGMLKDKKKHYIMADRYSTSIIYYYQILLGLSHANFVDKDNVFKQEVLDKYAELDVSEITRDILDKMTLAIETNDMIYDNNVKQLVNDYMNSMIYTEELMEALQDEDTYKYQLIEPKQNKQKENSLREQTEENADDEEVSEEEN